MDIDIGFWLSLALAITLIIWVADRLLKLRKRGGTVGSTVETSNSLISVLFIVLVIRSFIVEPFTIPSGSMLPTLRVNDFILVNKFSYGLRLPVTNTLVVPLGEPARGDIMVFKFPENRQQNFIKRVVGLPGDEVVIEDNVLSVNGQQVERKLVERLQSRGNWREERVEVLDGQAYTVWHEGRIQHFTGEHLVQAHTQGRWTVPEGYYFTIGDNRDNSNDSRFWGMVSEDLIVGKAFLIWMHWQPIFSLPSFARNGAIDKVEVD